MAKIETETQDLMNVESFSQLPFIRPSLPLNKDKGIRLFGIEFGSGADDPETLDNNNASSENNNNNNGNEEDDGSDNNKKSNNSENGMSEISRRFECNYCCRNFPTSQALGGHQNAHKRERQHAKREHLQSAMVMHAGGAHDAAHVYGLMNYSRALASHHHHHHHQHQPTYPSWNSTSSDRLYGSSIHGGLSYGAHHPINGSPVGMWRMASTVNPSLNRERSLMNPLVTPGLFAGQEMNKAVNVVGGGQSREHVYNGSSSSSSSVQQVDHVSLDLHL